MSVPFVSVVICSYSLERWDALAAAVASVSRQTVAPHELIVVADNNPELATRAARDFAGVRVVESSARRGLSAARNAGVALADGDIVAFLDDDAEAASDWLERLTAPYAQPRVVAVGGRVVPRWESGRPPWMPPTFDWVVGCTYEGHPDEPTEVRNPIGANMSFRRELIERVGGFDERVGRVPDQPSGCEETELCIRVRQMVPGAVVWYEPAAVVSHRVPESRATRAYFRSRCVAEGRSKKRVSRAVGPRDALASERRYVRKTLPLALWRSLASAAAGDRTGLPRAATNVWGALLTAFGYGCETFCRRPPAARAADELRADVSDGAVSHATVVVATHDRADSLRACLQSVLRSEGVDFDVVVVDNAPTSDSTATMLAAEFGDVPQVVVVREDIAGLGRAHNRGLELALGEIVAFTDDDVIVDPTWLARLVDVFRADPAVACVTGRILPLELETPAQRWLESYARYGKGEDRRSFDLDGYRPDDPLFPYAAGTFGSGANMAFRTSVLRSIGGFDELLGAGTRTRGGDDLAAFYAVVSNGHRLVYEPAAVVRHRHHPEYDVLRKGMFGYGAGLTAYLAKTVIDRPGAGLDVLRKAPAAVRHVFDPRSAKNRGISPDFPRRLRRIEHVGMLAGPWLYARSRIGART